MLIVHCLGGSNFSFSYGYFGGLYLGDFGVRLFVRVHPFVLKYSEIEVHNSYREELIATDCAESGVVILFQIFKLEDV